MNKIETVLVVYVTFNSLFIFWRFYCDVLYFKDKKKNQYFENEIMVLRHNFKNICDELDDWKSKYMQLLKFKNDMKSGSSEQT